MNIHSSAAVCWICLEGGVDKNGEPLVRDCACRGSDAGFAHTSCIIKYAQKKCEEAVYSHEFIAPWKMCPNCNQDYQNNHSVNLATAFVSYAKNTYGHPGNDLFHKLKVMEALKLQIRSNYDGASARGVEKGDINAIENLIYELLAMVDQAKKEHNMDGSVGMTTSSDKFQQYSHICSNYEAFGYESLGILYSKFDQGEDSTNTEIGFYEKARNIFISVGDTSEAKLMTYNIEQAKAKSERDYLGLLENTQKIYYSTLETYGEDAVKTIKAGLSYVACLQNANHSIEAERLVLKLAATSHQLCGEEHTCTKLSATVLSICKRRLVHMISPEFDANKVFRALRYENGGTNCIVAGPITDSNQDNKEEELDTFSIASSLIFPSIGCPVICHGLINASHLNGKLGDVRSVAMDGSEGFRYAVHFDDKSLKPVAVKPGNVRIAFEIASG